MWQCISLLNDTVILNQLSVGFEKDDKLRQIALRSYEAIDSDDGSEFTRFLKMEAGGNCIRHCETLWIACMRKFSLSQQAVMQRQLISRLIVLESSVGIP
jgi:hypothetical protein